MTTYEPTSEQEKAIREWLQESIVPLIEQVLVKKLGQAMSFAAQEVIKPQRTWVDIAPEEYPDIRYQRESYYAGIKWAEARLREKNA